MRKNNELSGVKEIARRANVSIATVDRVIHNRSGVSLKTKEKIETIIKEMDYKPNLLARQLASKRIFRFAVLIPKESEETEYWRLPLEGVKNAWSEIKLFGVELSFFLYDLSDRKTFSEESDKILKEDFQAVIVAPSFMAEAVLFFNACEKKHIKTVYINSDISSVTPLCYVGPDLFQSGKLGANLCKYLIGEDAKILILNVSRELDAEHHLMKKTSGFKAYFAEINSNVIIDVLTIHQTSYDSVKKELNKFLKKNDVNLIFVTNSRVFHVARYLEENAITNIRLIGYDNLSHNLEFLERTRIDFLLSQKPIEQGYQALMTVYNYFVNQDKVEKIKIMPIDILTKENYRYYKN